MAGISGFRIDDGVSFTFDIGGASPTPSGEGSVPVNAIISAWTIGQPIMGDLTVIEEE